MKKLLKYLKDYKKESVLGPLFKLLESLFDLLVPIVMAKIIDEGIGNSDKTVILEMGGLLALFAFIGIVCSLTAQYFCAKAAVGFTRGLKSALFAHINTLSYTEIDSLTTSSLITRMTSDMNQLQNAVNLALRLLLRSPFIVFGAMIAAFMIDVKGALVFAVTIPVLSAVVFGIMLGTVPLYKKVQAKLDRVLLRTRENLTGVRVIRAFCKEESEKKAFNEDNDTLVKFQLFAGKISALLNPLTFIIINAASAYLIYVGALRVDGGFIKQGEVIALYNYMAQILVELIKLANLIITMTKAAACAGRISGVFDIRSSQKFPEKESFSKETAENSDSAVVFSHVGLKYKNASDEALTDISFEAKKGESIGIIGSTGSGKTSLINLIPRFYDKTSGEIFIDGIKIEDYPKEILREKIGIVPQRAVLFRGTVEENIRWGNEEASAEDIENAVRVSQSADIVNQKGLDFMIEQGGKNLSGGQKQRLCIARAIVKKSEILILDDSASALDYATDLRLRTEISKLSWNPTVFIVSQRTASVMSCDKIIVLDDGEISAVGTHDELLEKSPVYNEIYSSQFKKEGA